MNIGFDAKRAYHNGTGLGHYSRTLLNSLSSLYSDNNYYLFNPKPGNRYKTDAANMHEVQPSGFLSKKLPSLWRTRWMVNSFDKLGLDIFHGLSHELPLGVKKAKAKTVVTMHDLIHERYPEQYKKVDVKIYTQKFKYACKVADAVIAISQQTKNDLMEFYNVPEEKITVCYQSCNPSFGIRVPSDEKRKVRERYNLPEQYYLYVGSIIERKNLLTICKALAMMGNDNYIPLVVIGNGGDYLDEVEEFVKKKGLEQKVIFLSQRKAARQSASFKDATDFPAIYQSALAMIYPSIFEGFGIPVLEALWSRLPVITSKVSALPEAGGEGSILINPLDVNELVEAMWAMQYDQGKRMQMIDEGWQHAHKFTNEKSAAAVMDVYKKLL